MKSVAIAGLALVGGVAARSTIHYDRHPSDPRTTFAHPQPAQTILTAHDDEFGIVDVKTDIQTVVMPGNRGRVTIGRDDDADDELHMHFNVPNNRGNFEVNDYTVRKDAEDDEFGIVDVKTDIQTVVMPGNRGRVTIGRDDADDELYYDYFKGKYQPMGISYEMERRREMMMKHDDDEFGIVNVKTDLQTVVMPGNSGPVTIRRDDADNELDMHFNVPNNRGNFQVNDYTKTHDDFDDEFGIVDVKTDIQTVVMPGNRGRVTIGRDDEADNELDMHFNVPNNRKNFIVNDYTVKKDAEDDEFDVVDYDDEFGIVDVKTDIQTVVMPGNKGHVTIKRDDADNELDMHFNVPNNRGNFVVNDYTVKKDAEDDEFGIVNVKTDLQTVVMPGNSGPVTIRRDAEDDEFGVIDYDDEFAVTNSKRLNKDEIDLLASILKLATQDKEGNVIIDGVKIGKIPQKVEAPKPKKFLAY